MKKTNDVLEIPLYPEFPCFDIATEPKERISDSLFLSLHDFGEVNIGFIAAVSEESEEKIIASLKGSIYQNPLTWNEDPYEGWETAEDYLSGDLYKKLKEADAADKKYHGLFRDNIEALKKIMPPPASWEDIFITLGSPWIPPDIIDDFIAHLIGKNKSRRNCKTQHNILSGKWVIPDKSRFKGTPNETKAYSTYGTEKMNALHIIEKTLNSKSIVITDKKTPDTASGVLNEEETALAIEKQELIEDEFHHWIWKSKARKERLEAIFTEKFWCFKKRNFDGSYLTFPGMSKDITLYPHQKNAVARILLSKENTLLAHKVGTGKTFTMIAAGMELRRLYLSKKNLYVVPNNVTGDWNNAFRKLYPNAKILYVKPKEFKPHQRKTVFNAINNGSYDAMLMASSSFDMIYPSKESYKENLEDQILKSKNRIEKLKNKIQNSSKDSKTILETERNLSKEKKKLSRLHRKIIEIGDNIFFDELNIDYLFVDEAHNYRNLKIEDFDAATTNISASSSRKCSLMHEKIRHIENTHNGRGIVFATGTPITNSLVDLFSLQTYLQHNKLKHLGCSAFNDWIGMFANKETNMEIDVDTQKYKLRNRYSEFHNMKTLMSILSFVTDFYEDSSSCKVPISAKFETILCPQTAQLKEFNKEVSVRVDCIRKRQVSRKDDNMLVVTTDGKKAAIDIRLCDENANFSTKSKVNHCAEKVFKIYKTTETNRSVQLVFCDISIPKKTFNIYDELKRLLVNKGIPAEEIAYIHEAETDKERNELFDKAREGTIRVLIGSTQKLGVGVNIQTKLIALHHLDAPWRPSDLTQREGRIIRQGNKNPEVYIYKYITEGSFDSYLWQILEYKQKIISQVLSGFASNTVCDVDDTVLSYAQAKALAIGDPLLKKRFETSSKLNQFVTLQRGSEKKCEELKKKLKNVSDIIENYNNLLSDFKDDSKFYQTVKKNCSKTERERIDEMVFKAVGNNAMRAREQSLLEYQGFKVVLPAKMSAADPFVILRRKADYNVKIGSKATGISLKFDKTLKGVKKSIENTKELISRQRKLQLDIKDALCKAKNYSSEIESLKIDLENLDETLYLACG